MANEKINAAKEQTRVMLQTMITLASAAFGLIVALAWNEAIKTLMERLLGKEDNLAGLFTYAIIATIVAVVAVVLLGRAAAKVGGEAAITREADL
jgi:ABC-type multidrug transport system fused ATPase/permease subunit